MKKSLYVAPTMEHCGFASQETLMAISALTDTNVPGLGVSDEPTEDEGRVKGAFDF